MSDKFNNQLANFEFSLIKTVEIAKKYGSPEYQDLNLYINLIDKISQIRVDSKNVSDIVQSAGQLDTVEKLEDILKKSKNKKTNFKKTDKYINLTRQINDIFNPSDNRRDLINRDDHDDDDELSMQAEISPIDPITKKIIEHPVKNKICNHRYEKTTILESIQQNPRLRCPVVGCANKNFITENNLEEDFEFMQLRAKTNNAKLVYL